MIKSLTVTNYLGETIVLPLGEPEKSGFLITAIDGLGPAKATINTTEVSTNDGAIFNSARLSKRNIVLSLQLLPNPTIEDTRQLSYKYFPIKKNLTLLIETDNRIAEVKGYVESNEPKIFSKKEETDISIVCPDSFFYSKGTNITIFYGIVNGFEFPFENNSLTENLIEFGQINNYDSQSVYYNGDSEVGVNIIMHALGEVKMITIYNTRTRESMAIDTDKLATLTGSGIIAGDDILISTMKGSKYIILFRAGVAYNILNCLAKGSDWFQLSKGDNVFAYTTTFGKANLQFRIENKILYEGI